jgi:hypothetical protein
MLTDPAEAVVVEQIQVRLVRPEEEARWDQDGTIALMDALHTQVQTARVIVQEGGGDYVLVVKGNQGDLQKQAAHFLPEVFSPSVSNTGSRPRPHRMARHRGQGSDPHPDGLSARGTGGAD